MSSLLLHRRLNSLSPHWRNVGDSATALRVLCGNFAFVLATRSFSSVEEGTTCKKQMREEQRRLFTVCYLVNSCGLSLKSAESKFRYVKFDAPEKPDSNIRFLKSHGFTDAQITKVVKSFPRVLIIDANKYLLPKLEFLRSIGFSSSESAKLISSHARILDCSLNNKLIPCYDFLKSILGKDEAVLKCLQRSQRVLVMDIQKKIVPTVSVLRGLGVPQAHIKDLFAWSPLVLLHPAKRFDEKVNDVIGFGFDPSKVSFIQALTVVIQLKKSTWECKISVYKRWGWSQDDVFSAFKKFPICMALSEKKITSIMDFLVNKMGLQPSSIAKSPRILSRSLEQSIIPRYMVVAVLLSKGFLKKEDVNYLVMLQLDGKRFMDRFVSKYQKDVPQLLSILEKKIGAQELGLYENLIG